MQVEFNNAAGLNTEGTGWFMGFSEWAKANAPGMADLRYAPRDQRSHSLCVKWMKHPAGDPRGGTKPLSTGRSVSILVSESGRFRVEFCEHPDFPRNQVLRHMLTRHGDFVAWGAYLYHRWTALEESTILTLRWIPDDATMQGAVLGADADRSR